MFAQKEKNLSIAERWKKVNQLTEKQLTESALKEVDNILKQARSEQKADEEIKAMVFKAGLIIQKNPDLAVAQVSSFEKFTEGCKQPDEKAFLHSMVAQMYAMYYQNNQYTINRRTDITGYIPDSISEWSKNIFFQKITRHIDASLADSKILLKTDPLKFKAMIEKGNDARRFRPTLFDFLAYRAIDIYQSVSNATVVENPLTSSQWFADASEFEKTENDKTYAGSTANYITDIYRQIISAHWTDANKDALIYSDLERLEYIHSNSENDIKDELYLAALSRMEKQYRDNELSVEIMAKRAQFYFDDERDDNDESEIMTAKEVYDICENGINRFPGYKRIGLLKNIQAQLLQKDVTVSCENEQNPVDSIHFNISSINVKSIQIAIYKVNATAVQYLKYQSGNRSEGRHYPNRALVSKNTIPVKPSNNFTSVSTPYRIKAPDYGIYEYEVSAPEANDPKNYASGSFTVTGLTYFIRSTESKVSDVYVVDRISGHPAANATVHVYYQKWNNNGYDYNEKGSYTTDSKGFVKVPKENDYDSQIYVLEKGGDKFYSENIHSYFNGNGTSNTVKTQLALLTDRSLYRPGQTVFFKGIAYNIDKNVHETVTGKTYEITLYNANGQKVSSKSFTTNKFGSFAGEFVLPSGGLNGYFRISSGDYSTGVWVEEYKRPTFEVKIERPKSEVKFDHPVTFTGNIKAYSGYNVPNAKVKYRIVRDPHHFCWWWYGNFNQKQVDKGETTTDANGNFSINFTPAKPSADKWALRYGQFYTYTVFVDATDTKGETQQGQQSFSVGDKSLFIVADISEKIEKKNPVNLKISTFTINDEPVHSVIDYYIARMENSKAFADDNNTGDKAESNGIEAEKIISGTYDTDNKTLTLPSSKWASGRYKIVLTTHDKNGEKVSTEKYFILYGDDDKRPPVNTYVWLTNDKMECDANATAQVKFGTSTTGSMVLYEVMQGNKIIESRWENFDNEIKTFPVQMKESYGAGVTARFTFVKNNRFFSRTVTISRKAEERKLALKWSVFRDKLQPGEKATWTVTVPQASQNGNEAELLAAMYDASLDAIRPHSWSFNPVYNESVPYAPEWQSAGFQSNTQSASYNEKTVDVPDWIQDQLNWYGFSMEDANMHVKFRIRGVATMSAPVLKSAKEDVAANDMVLGNVAEKKELNESIVAIGYGTTTEKPKPVKVRTNFNETAFFYPQLATDKTGNVSFTFTAPESLTRWNVKLLAHTTGLYFGAADTTAVTRKEVMVQMNLPRFVRQSDQLMLTANVVNLIDQPLTADVQPELSDPISGKTIFTENCAKQQVALNAGETKVVEWSLPALKLYDMVVCKITAQAGNYSDGEQKYLPVLPDKQLITETLPLIIRNHQTRTFHFDRLTDNINQVETKNLAVEFSSNPVWYAVQALPSVAQPDNDNALDYFTAYYANSLAAHIATSDPKIKNVFEQWKNSNGGNREALLSNLGKNSELKNMLLDETPWVTDAKNESEQKREIALLFDTNLQQNKSGEFLAKLQKLQKPSGGFPWFEGMPESRYITQEILLNMARLARLTGTRNTLTTDPSTKDIVVKALGYLDNEISRDFAELKRYNKNYEKEMCVDNLQLFYLHTRSEYADVPVTASARDAVRFYTSQSEKYWTQFTLYGKAMMAVVAKRNGKTALAGEILKSLKENALKTDDSGMYWAKNTAGYFWSERPIDIQAALIEAFTEIEGKTPDIDEMKIWLLKQKQTQRWDAPMSTVNAIYALLLSGDNWLADNGNVEISVGSTRLTPTTTEAGTGYFKEQVVPDKADKQAGTITVDAKNTTGSSIGWGAVYWQYEQDMDKIAPQKNPLQINKKLFVKKTGDFGTSMLPIEQTTVGKGDKVVVRLTVSTDRDMEYVTVKDLRAGCFEPVEQRSACMWKEKVCYYQTVKDASTQLFFERLPKGSYVFEYEVYANNSGEFSGGIATIQCMYAPEFTSHTGSPRVTVK